MHSDGVRFDLTAVRALCTLVGMFTPAKIRALRSSLGWNQKAMADYLGVDRSTVSRIESDQEPSGPVLRLLQQLDAERANNTTIEQQQTGAA